MSEAAPSRRKAAPHFEFVLTDAPTWTSRGTSGRASECRGALERFRGVAAAGTPAAPDDDEPPPWVRPSSVGERPPPPRSEVNVVADDGELYALD